MATAIKTEVVGALQFTIETIGEAKNAWNSFMQTIGVKDKPKKSGSSGGNQVFPDGTYWETTDSQGNVTASGRWLNGKRVQTGLGDVVVTGHTPDKSTPKTRTTPRSTFDASKIAFTSGEGVKADPDQYFQSVWAMADKEKMRSSMNGWNDIGAYLGIPTSIWDAMRKQTGLGYKQDDFGKILKEYISDPDKEKREKDEKNQSTMLEGITAMNTSLQNIFGGIQQLGFEIPQELMDILSVMQTITGIVSAIQTLSTVKLFGFAGGGIVPHAANGYYVPGNHYSGDVTPILANAGELVLSRSQQNALAGQLQNSGLSGLQLEAVVRGEDLRFIINSNGRRTGRGEIVTTNFR